jgi:hypothetical protein
MADSAELIEWHYSDPDSGEKKDLIEHLITCWAGIKEHHLQKNLESILNIDNMEIENRPLILLLTMRNRKRMGKEIKENDRDFSGLKQLLTHLDKQGVKPFVEDECTKAILSDNNYSTKGNHVIMFQIERIRRIRAKSKPTNHNLDFCVKILNTLQIEDDDDPYSAINISSKSLKGLLMLQRALCSARTASYADTIKFAEQSEKDYESNNKEITQLIKLHIWWTYEVRERTFARCFMIEERKRWRNKANNILNNEIDDIKLGYLNSLRPKANGVLDENVLFNKVLRLDHEDDYVPNMNHHLYSYHILLSRYLKYCEKWKIKKKFEQQQIEEMFDTSKKGWMKYKREMNQFLNLGITGDSRKESSTRAQALLYNHTSLTEKSVLIERMKKCCTSAILLVQSANERYNSYLILQLTLVAIDLLAKLDRLGQLILRIDKKRGYTLRAPNNPKNNSINIEDIKHIKSLMQKLFHKIKIVMETHFQVQDSIFSKSKVPLFNWISGMSSVLNKLEITEEMKGLTEIKNICKKAILWDENNTSGREYHGEILLHFLAYGKDGAISDNGKPINFFAHFQSEKKSERWTPYSLNPGETRFSELKG